MSFTITYKILFEMNIYHHYFLDDGVISFDNSITLKQEQLSKYNIDEFLTVIPSEETLTKCIGHKIILRKTASGFIVLIKAEETAPDVFKPFVNLKTTETLTFLMYTKDALFENYSTVNAIPSIPFHFSNTNVNINDANYKPIDLDQIVSTTPIEDYKIEQDTFDILSAQLTAAEKQKLFGIVTIKMNGDDANLNVLNVDETIKINPKVFKIQMKNRLTNWVYNDAQDGSFIYATPSTHPLVKNGIVKDPELELDEKKLPSAIPNRIRFVKDGNGNITETISEIFI